MPRPIAWLIAITASILVFVLAFTSFTQPLDRYRSDGEGGLVRQTAECPAPFANVFMGSVPENANDELTCHLASRTLLFEAAFVILAGALLTWAPITRPRPERIEPISTKIQRHRSD